MSTKPIMLFAFDRGIKKTIDVVQGDSARALLVEFFDTDLTEFTTARIYIRKPDDTEVYNNCTISNNRVIAPLTAQMLAAKGKARAQIQLTKSTGTVTCFEFILDIKESLVSSSSIESSSEYTALEELLFRAEASVVNSSSEMVDHGTIYYLTTDRMYYYWNDGINDWDTLDYRGKGISSIAKTSTSGNVDTYTITYDDGTTSTFNITNGSVTSVGGKTGEVDGIVVETITNRNTTLGDIKTMLDNASLAGNHIIFDVSALGTDMKLCAASVDTVSGIFRISDIANQKISKFDYDPTTLLIIAMANAYEIATEKQINDYDALGKMILDGTSDQYIKPGDILKVNRLTSITGTCPNNNVFVFFDSQDGGRKFINKMNECEERSYIFVYDGENILYHNEIIDPDDYGMIISGLQDLVAGDVITITTSVEVVEKVFVDYDPSGENSVKPVSNSVPHYWILEDRYNDKAGSVVFDAPESFLCITKGNTLRAGSYYIYNLPEAVNEYWCNYKRLYYVFEVLHDIIAPGNTDIIFTPISYGIRETTGDARGYYDLTFRGMYRETHTPLSDEIEVVGQIEAPFDDIIDIRTFASADQSLTNTGIIYNYLGHCILGNPAFNVSNIHTLLNYEYRQVGYKMYAHKNDLMDSDITHKNSSWWGLDPRFKRLVLSVNKKLRHSVCDEFNSGELYEFETKFFLLSSYEMSMDLQQNEGSVTALYDEYTNHVLTNAAVYSRAKANFNELEPTVHRWTSSAHSTNSRYARLVTMYGASANGNCKSQYGFAPACAIGLESSN